jgi:hypothetical protein
MTRLTTCGCPADYLSSIPPRADDQRFIDTSPILFVPSRQETFRDASECLLIMLSGEIPVRTRDQLLSSRNDPTPYCLAFSSRSSTLIVCLYCLAFKQNSGSSSSGFSGSQPLHFPFHSSILSNQYFCFRPSPVQLVATSLPYCAYSPTRSRVGVCQPTNNIVTAVKTRIAIWTRLRLKRGRPELKFGDEEGDVFVGSA